MALQQTIGDWDKSPQSLKEKSKLGNFDFIS